MRIKAFRLSILFLFFIVISTLPTSSQTSTKVIGTNNPTVDVAAVQNAVDNYQIVILEGTFNFGYGWIEITKSVTITAHKTTGATLIGEFFFNIHSPGVKILNLTMNASRGAAIEAFDIPAGEPIEIIGNTINKWPFYSQTPIYTYKVSCPLKIIGNTIDVNYGGWSMLIYKSYDVVDVIDNTIYRTQRGPWILDLQNSTIENNKILDFLGNNILSTIYGYAGLLVGRSAINCTIRGNLIQQDISQETPAMGGILVGAGGDPLANCYGNIIENNTISGNFLYAMLFQKVIYDGEPRGNSYSNTVRDNIITGEADVGILVRGEVYDFTFVGNDLSGLNAAKAQFQVAEGINYDTSTFPATEYPAGCYPYGHKFGGNILGSAGESAVAIWGYNNSIICNDYSQSNLPGWTTASPDGPGCVFLDEGSTGNVVAECLFPEGTTSSEQILDLTDDPATEEYDGYNQILSCLERSIYLINELISEVESLVEEGKLTKGQGNSLIKKLEEAIRQMNRGNIRPACGKLGDFIDEVNALIQSGKLAPEEGHSLIDEAKIVMTCLCR